MSETTTVDELETTTDELENEAGAETKKPSWRARIFAWLRSLVVLAIVGAVMLAITSAIVLSNARKQLHRGLTMVGTDLIQQYEMNEEAGVVDGAPRVFVLNGQEINVRAAYDERDVDAVLASMPGECERFDEEDGRSHQTCVDGGLTFESIGSIAQGDSPDLSELRYRLAVGQDEGGTFYLELSPKESFDPQKLLSGDVEGPEHADIPRPPGGRRFMSAYERGKPYLLSMFTGSERSIAEMKEFYRENMDPETWIPVDDVEDESHLMYLRRGAPYRFVLLTFRPSKAEEGTTLTAITEAQ